jgi:hypothetical protein
MSLTDRGIAALPIPASGQQFHSDRSIAGFGVRVSAKAVVRRVATFIEFTADNDPHGEHDFGNFSLAGHKFFWKVDAYDADMRYASEDPTDPTKTARVLTIMLADEY